MASVLVAPMSSFPHLQRDPLFRTVSHAANRRQETNSSSPSDEHVVPSPRDISRKHKEDLLICSTHHHAPTFFSSLCPDFALLACYHLLMHSLKSSSVFSDTPFEPEPHQEHRTQKNMMSSAAGIKKVDSQHKLADPTGVYSPLKVSRSVPTFQEYQRYLKEEWGNSDDVSFGAPSDVPMVPKNRTESYIHSVIVEKMSSCQEVRPAC